MDKCLYFSERWNLCKGTVRNGTYPICTCGGDKSKCNFMLSQADELNHLIQNNKLGDAIWQGLWLTFPLYPCFSDSQIYHRNVFEEMIHKKITFKDFQNMLDGYVRARNIIFGVSCVNSEYYLIREKTKFVFYIHNGVFKLWDDNERFIGAYNIDMNDIPSDEFIKWIEDITKEYCNGLIHCSDCGNVIHKQEVAGRYFAGIYCKDCWENRGWREKEARETYD